MEQLNYQPESFSGIIPELQVPDYSSSYIESGKAQMSSMQEKLQELRNKQTVDLANQKQASDEFDQLMKLTAEGAKRGLELRQKMKEDEYDRIFFEYYNKDPKELQALQDQQTAQEQSLKDDAVQDNAAVATAVRRDPENAGSLNRLNGLSGWRKAAAMNALALARVGQYPEFRKKIFDQLNPKTPEEMRAAEAEAMSQWARQTGMSQANPGFLAKHVIPGIRRENETANKQWMRQYNATEGEKSRMITQSQFESGEITLEQARVAMTATTSSDGNTLFSNAQFIQYIGRAAADGRLSVTQLQTIGDQKNEVTGKLWKEDGRWGTWMDSARSYQVKKKNLDRSEQQIRLRQRLEGLNREQIEQLLPGLRAEFDDDLVQDALGTARRSDAEADRIRQGIDVVTSYLSANPGKKVPVEIWRDLPYEVRRQFQSELEPDTSGETALEGLLGSDEGKALPKDIPSLISSVDPTIRLENKALGQSGPSNQRAFELQVRNQILARAAQLMLTGDGSMGRAQAIQTAKDEWVKAQKDLIKAKGLQAFFKDGKFVTGYSDPNYSGPNVGQAQAAAMTARAIQNATLQNLDDAMYESDYEYRPNGNYSERVKLLARKFGLLPIDIVNRARVNKGMKPIEVPERGVSSFQSSDRARLSSVTNPSTQSLLRSQIRSGQVLSGTPEQKAVAVGRHLLALGYGGIWQNQFFSYENGYVPSGGQRVMQRDYPSAHNEGQGRALDIGLGANGEARLDELAAYLRKNQKQLGITKILWRTAGHFDHIHIEF